MKHKKSNRKNTPYLYSKHMGSILSPETLFERDSGLPRAEIRGIFKQSVMADLREI